MQSGASLHAEVEAKVEEAQPAVYARPFQGIEGAALDILNHISNIFKSYSVEY